jgi:uncharacterized protein YggU (UPF0235/DUF167 family)
LLVAVSARAVDGRANEAVLRVLAAALGIRRQSMTLRLGATARDKVIMVDPAPEDLAARVSTLMGDDRS